MLSTGGLKKDDREPRLCKLSSLLSTFFNVRAVVNLGGADWTILPTRMGYNSNADSGLRITTSSLTASGALREVARRSSEATEHFKRVISGTGEVTVPLAPIFKTHRVWYKLLTNACYFAMQQNEKAT